MVPFWALPMGSQTGSTEQEGRRLLAAWPPPLTVLPCLGVHFGLVLSSNKCLPSVEEETETLKTQVGNTHPTFVLCF